MKRYTAILSSLAEEYLPIIEESFDVIMLPSDKALDTPVNTHPDMIVFCLDDKVILPKEYHISNPHVARAIEENTGSKVVPSDSPRSQKYPFDVSLNTLVCGEVAMGLEKHVAPEIKCLFELKGIRLVDVKQGYATCSSLVLENAVISADPSIISACESLDLPHLQIKSGNIRLDGYSEGFIGGASGVCENTVYFLGNIERHPDHKKILEFLKTQGYSAVSLSDGELSDFGGIKFIPNKD